MTKVEINPNQYGYAERGEKPAKPQPFGGKGDHDGDGKPGGAKKPVDKPAGRAKK